MLPRISYFTRLNYFILGSNILIFLALLETVISSAIARDNKEKIDPYLTANNLTAICSESLGKIVDVERAYILTGGCRLVVIQLIQTRVLGVIFVVVNM